MRPSKIFISSLLTLFAVGLISCTQPDKNPDGINGKANAEGTATFRIDSLKGKGTIAPFITAKGPESALAAAWRIPMAVNFRFTACIQDRISHAKAANHRFLVEIPGTGQQIADIKPTTSTGCFNWMEPVPFNYFVKRSHWGIIERDIIGTGVHTGRQRVRIAINPWAIGDRARDKGDEVAYLRDEPLPDALLSPEPEAHAFADEKVLKDDQLFVDDVDVQTIRRGERDKGMMLRLNISMTPRVRFESNAGVPGMRTLTDGEFFVIAHLVLNNAGPKLKDRVILTSSSQEGNPNGILAGEDTPGVVGQGKLINGKLISRVDVWVDPRMPQGNLELAIKLIPKGLRGLSSFEGIYELGALKTLSSHFSGALSEECRDQGTCKISPYLKGASNFEKLHSEGYANNNFPYLFDRLKLRFVQVQPGETTMQRTVAYSASTCVIDAFTGDHPVGMPFTIRYKATEKDEQARREGKEIKHDLIVAKRTEEDGCLNWSSNIEHKYYNPEEFIEQLVSIEKDSGVKRDLRFYINPWDDKFTFGFDEREFKPEFWAEMKKRRKIKSRFFLGEYGYHTVRFQYNIDSLMSLEVRKTVLMELSPRVLRYSGIVNARKMTEPLRDGVWLLKVAIQKNYLDPAQNGTTIDTLRENQALVRTAGESAKAQERMSSNRLRKLGIVAPSKEFISTQTALVRSTDGLIIQPVELKMEDLRMMRVRSNFLVELEAVDERKLQAHNVLHHGFGEEIQKIADERRIKNESLGKGPISEDEKKEIEALEEKNRAMVDARRTLIRRLFDEVANILNYSSNNEINLDSFKLDESQQRFLKPLFEKLNLELQANDFTNIKLPSCHDINCNLFLEPGAGLERRTFVGPVIFLSNGYKDSIRATDNLDEAMCYTQVDYDDPFEAELKGKERELFADSELKVKPDRQNTIYKFSEYFGSLRHLCFKHVDDLIKRENEGRYVFERNIPVTSSVYNFAAAYNLEFLSLSDEKPMRVDMSPDTLRRCDGDLVACMRETEDHRLPLATALGWINANLGITQSWLRNVGNFVWGTNNSIQGTVWDREDLRRSLFEKGNPLEKRFASCVLVTSNLLETLRTSGKRVFATTLDQVQENIMDSCMKNHDNPILFDQKLRVFKAGQDGDSYVFLGGYQMNINVGQSFSVGRANAYSWGWSLEATDLASSVNGLMGLKGGVMSSSAGAAGMVTGIGPGAVGKFASGIKPLSLKLNGSSSFSDSEGTSISESTYLVAQIAKFHVRLDEFERCVVLSFTPAFQKVLGLQGRFVWDSSQFGTMHPVFACEGVKNAKPRFVDETYFYFTQHFTEGDMLDQADLYNHPWLLGLRGYRDFGAFVSMIRAQEVMSFKNFVSGVFEPKKRPIDWPLGHLKEVYRQIVPSFPGFYTVLDDSELGAEFPLEKRFSKTDSDINNEVFSRDRKIDPRRQ